MKRAMRYYVVMKNIATSKLGSNVSEVLRSLQREKAAALIDGRGETAAYLVDTATFEGMRSRIRLLEGIARGERAYEEGRTLSHDQVKRKMARWLKNK